jgi:hypothetical protein
LLLVTLPSFVVAVERRALGGHPAWSVAWVGRLALAGACAGAVEYLLWVGLGRTWLGAGLAIAAGTAAFALVTGIRQNLALFAPRGRLAAR